MTAPFKEYPYQPDLLKNIEPPIYPDIPSQKKQPPPNWPLPFIPRFQNLPDGRQPTLEGYPWWVDPTFLNPPPAPAQPPISPFPLGPSDVANRSGDAPANLLLSYYNQNLAQPDAPQPADGFDPAVQGNASPQDIPERRLGRRTYRA